MRTKSNEKAIKTQTVGPIAPLAEELRNDNIKIGISPEFKYSGYYKIGQLNCFAFHIFNKYDTVIADARAEINAGDYVWLEYRDTENEGHFALFQFIEKIGRCNYRFYYWKDGRRLKDTILWEHVKSMYKIVKIIKSFEPGDWELSVIEKEEEEASRKEKLEK